MPNYKVTAEASMEWHVEAENEEDAIGAAFELLSESWDGDFNTLLNWKAIKEVNDAN